MGTSWGLQDRRPGLLVRTASHPSFIIVIKPVLREGLALQAVFKCGTCGEKYEFGLRECPSCHAVNPLLRAGDVKPPTPVLNKKGPRLGWLRSGPERAAPTPTVRCATARSCRSRPPFRRRAIGASLRGTQDRPRLGSDAQWWYVHVSGDLPIFALAGHVLEWERVGAEANHVVVRPVETAWTPGLRSRLAADQRIFKVRGYGPRAAGTTSIEAKSSLVQQSEEINRLASQVDRPHAWADIASCWGNKALQLPIKKAFGQIGCGYRINWLVPAREPGLARGSSSRWSSTRSPAVPRPEESSRSTRMTTSCRTSERQLQPSMARGARVAGTSTIAMTHRCA